MVDHMLRPRPPPAVGLMMTWTVPEREERATTDEPAVLSPPNWVVAPTAHFEPYEFNGTDLLPLAGTLRIGHPSPGDLDEFAGDILRVAASHGQTVVGPFDVVQRGGGERVEHLVEERGLGERIPRAVEEQHRYADLLQM